MPGALVEFRRHGRRNSTIDAGGTCGGVELVLSRWATPARFEGRWRQRNRRRWRRAPGRRSSWPPTGAPRASPYGSGRARHASRWTAADRRHERRWIRDAQRGSGEALEALYRRHWPWAHRAAYLVVHDQAAAEDIAQEAFLAAVRALDRFDRRRPFGPWLHRIVVNRAIDWARARALRREAEMESEPDADATVARRDPRAGAQPALLRERGRRPGLALARAPGGRRPAGTCSSTRRARSPRRSSFPGEPSTRACAGRSTGWAGS